MMPDKLKITAIKCDSALEIWEGGKLVKAFTQDELNDLAHKSIPMKPTVEILEFKDEDGKVYRTEEVCRCGNCNAIIKTFNSYVDSKYCYLCGRKIDWSDKE